MSAFSFIIAYVQRLSTFQRDQMIASLGAETFDLIVVGGGITGAGIALDASSRGMKVLLLEKYDFAGGTSSKSTKLIHGGLRYLKQMEFALVRKVGMERAVIHRLAPHLVRPVNMLLPIFKNGSLGKITTSLALWVYDFLAKVKHEDQYKMLGPKQTMEAEPMLNKDGLIGGAMYKEYRTDDARLTMEIIKTASEHGATCLNYAKVEELLLADGNISGVCFSDLVSGKKMSVHAHAVVNAAGPWVDDVRRLEGEINGKTLVLTKGIHIVINKIVLPLQHAMYFDVGDGRMIFTIPRNDKVYIGTTDTSYTGDKDLIGITQEDVNYLLHAVNRMFPSTKIKHTDIESAWAGLRPLIREEGKKASELSRKDEIFISGNGLISIAGGKLTGYRKMAEKTVDIVSAKMSKISGRDFRSCYTDEILLHGAAFEISVDEFIERRAGEAKQVHVSYSDVVYLVHTYGTDAEVIIEKIFELYSGITDPRERLLYAELWYCAEYEMITSLSDFIIRRTGRFYFDMPAVEKEYKMIAHLLGDLLQLDPNEVEFQIKHLEETMRQVDEISRSEP